MHPMVRCRVPVSPTCVGFRLRDGTTVVPIVRVRADPDNPREPQPRLRIGVEIRDAPEGGKRKYMIDRSFPIATVFNDPDVGYPLAAFCGKSPDDVYAEIATETLWRECKEFRLYVDTRVPDCISVRVEFRGETYWRYLPPEETGKICARS